MKKHLITLVAAHALAGAALAQVTVSDPWIRATVPQQTATGAFMQLLAARDTRLVEVRSPVAGIAEIHHMQLEGHTMRMHPVDSVALPAGQSVSLASGGYHIMLTELKRQLKAGETVPLSLVLEDKSKKREIVTLQVAVKPLTFVSPHSAGQGGH